MNPWNLGYWAIVIAVFTLAVAGYVHGERQSEGIRIFINKVKVEEMLR